MSLSCPGHIVPCHPQPISLLTAMCIRRLCIVAEQPHAAYWMPHQHLLHCINCRLIPLHQLPLDALADSIIKQAVMGPCTSSPRSQDHFHRRHSSVGHGPPRCATQQPGSRARCHRHARGVGCQSRRGSSNDGAPASCTRLHKNLYSAADEEVDVAHFPTLAQEELACTKRWQAPAR